MVNKESEKVNKYVDLASIIGTEHKVQNILKALDDFKNKQKVYEIMLFDICKSMYILRVYSIHYTLG